MATTDPTRQVQRTHTCLCILVDPEDSDRVLDSCMRAEVPADQPFCDYCVSAGHDRHPSQRPVAETLRRREAARKAMGLNG